MSKDQFTDWVTDYVKRTGRVPDEAWIEWSAIAAQEKAK